MGVQWRTGEGGKASRQLQSCQVAVITATLIVAVFENYMAVKLAAESGPYYIGPTLIRKTAVGQISF
jgi:hypothetical protein